VRSSLRGWCCLVLGLGLSWSAEVRAAELAWSAPAECPARAQVEAQVERVLGRPLREVEGIDFSVRIEREQRRRFRLELTSESRAHTRLPRERVLFGRSCAEVADAAALAIAMAVSEDAAASGGPPPPAAEPEDEYAAEPEPEQPPPAAIAPARTADAAPAAPPAADGGGRVELSAGVGLWLDSAALPALAAGAGLEVSARYAALRLSISGGLFAAQEARPLAAGGGGRFGLYLGAALLCLQPSAEGLYAMGCAGFELGRMTADGVGLDRGKNRATAWRALRAELGLGYRLNAWLAAVARIGGVVPLVSAEFLANGDERVHVLPSLSARASFGFELRP
jgi:hypothetical protein